MRRERLRRQRARAGWVRVLGTRSAVFEAEAHRQSGVVAESPHADEDQAFVDVVSDRGSG